MSPPSWVFVASFSNLEIMWGGRPCAVSAEHVAVTRVLYNGQMCIQLNMAEPTSVIFCPWKIKSHPWKVLEFWFDKDVQAWNV